MTYAGSGTRFSSYSHLQRAHVWGCPVYVLDPRLQDGKKIPKWSPRSRRGQFLGYSPEHSTTIGCILNIRTGSVSPQYHVVYDDHFSSVPNAEAGGLFGDVPFNANDWAHLVASGHERVLEQDFDRAGNPIPIPPLHEEWQQPQSRHRHPPHPLRHPHRHVPRPPSHLPPCSISPPVTASEGEREQNEQDAQQEMEPAPSGHDTASEGDDSLEGAIDDTLDNDTDQQNDESVVDNAADLDQQATETPVYTRSGREVKPRKRLIEGHPTHFKHEQDQFFNPKRKVSGSHLNRQFLMSLNWGQVVESLRSADLRALLTQNEYDFEQGTVEWMHPFTLAARANAEDNPTWEEAMSGPDRAGY